MAELAATMCGVHAQIISAAELSLGLRVADSTRKDVQEALWSDHTLIKTYGPRGTVHLLAADDLPMWSGALSMLPMKRPNFGKDIELSAAQTDEIVAAIGDALSDSELTTDELTAAVAERCGSWAADPVMPAFQTLWPRWRMVTDIAANRGVLCFGPQRGRNITYTNPHRWLPDFTLMEGQAAQAALLKRYLYAYGPATPAHFAQWLSAPRTWASELFQSLSDELVEVDLEGTQAWLLKGDTEMPDTSPRGLHLLPYFDAYVVGVHPRDRVFPGMASTRALAGGQAGNFPVLLIDGVAAGVWHQKKSGRKLIITVEALDPLSPAQREALEEQVARVGKFLEAKPELTLGPVTVGAHA
jgi:hypothetical protein